MRKLDSYATYFLVSPLTLTDSFFAHSVVLVCSHDKQAAIGLALHKTMPGSVQDLLEQLEIPCTVAHLDQHAVLVGGPIDTQRGFVLHTPTKTQWESCASIIPNSLYLTSSRDILEAIGRGEGPESFVIALGYSGWDAGQLDSEVQSGDWLVVPFSPIALFHMPAGKKWEGIPQLIGVDIHRLLGQPGRV